MIFPSHTASVLKSLPDAEQKRLTHQVRERAYPKGAVLFHAEDRAQYVWLVLKGRIHLTQLSWGGRLLTQCVLIPGELFCCLSTLDQKTYPSDAVAAVDSVVAKIPISLFSEWFSKYPEFARKTLCYFCERLRAAEQKGCLLQEPVRGRILRVLWILLGKFGQVIPFTCREVAEMAGTTIETTIRTFAQLKQEGLIRAGRARISVIDKEKLQELAGV